mgnify:CR=1 FL=1
MKLVLDSHSGVPFYRQIIDQVKSAIVTGNITPGDRLPTVRQLAVDLSINPNTVSRAYMELELTGLVDTQMGSGTFISHQKVDRDEIERRRLVEIDLAGLEGGKRGLLVGDVLNDHAVDVGDLAAGKAGGRSRTRHVGLVLVVDVALTGAGLVLVELEGA